MKLFRIIIKLIEVLHLVPSDELAQLITDVNHWEEKAMSNPETKIEELYGKLHKGVGFRLASPFIFVFLKRYVDDTLNGKVSGERDDYLD